MAVATAKPLRVNKLRSIANPHRAIWTAPLAFFLRPTLMLQAKNLRRFVVENFRTSVAKSLLWRPGAIDTSDDAVAWIHGEEPCTK